MDSLELVIKAFKDSAEVLSAGQVAEKTGIDRKEVDKIMTKLKKEEKIISPKKCFWTLK